MNAEAHLLSLGWAGPGHALNSHLKSHKGRGGLGLTKPLLVSQKKNTFGIGKKAHEPPSGNQWWLKGFEKALQGVGKDGSKSGSEVTSGAATPTGTVDRYTGKHAGLYGFFVRGKEMEGTIEEDELRLRSERQNEVLAKKDSKKRKSNALQEDNLAESGTQKDTTVSSKKSRKNKGVSAANDFAQISDFLRARDKSRKRSSRPAKQDADTQFRQISTFLETRDDLDPLVKKRKERNGETVHELDVASTEGSQFPTPLESDSELVKQERRRRRKEEKRKRKDVDEEQRSNWVALVDGADSTQKEVTNAFPTDEDGRRRNKALKRQAKQEERKRKVMEQENTLQDQTNRGASHPANTILAWDRAVKNLT